MDVKISRFVQVNHKRKHSYWLVVLAVQRVGFVFTRSKLFYHDLTQAGSTVNSVSVGCEDAYSNCLNSSLVCRLPSWLQPGGPSK